MIGLALVSAGGVLAASIVKSANGIIDRSVGADFIVTAGNFMPIPGDVAEGDQLGRRRRRRHVVPVGPGQGREERRLPAGRHGGHGRPDAASSTVVTGDVGASADQDTMLVDAGRCQGQGLEGRRPGARRPSARPATPTSSSVAPTARTRSPATT